MGKYIIKVKRARDVHFIRDKEKGKSLLNCDGRLQGPSGIQSGP